VAVDYAQHMQMLTNVTNFSYINVTFSTGILTIIQRWHHSWTENISQCRQHSERVWLKARQNNSNGGRKS